MSYRRSFITTIAVGLFVAPLAAEAQQAAKVWRIGFVEAGSPSANPHLLGAFRQGLSELGYEKQQVTIEDRWAEGRNELFPGLLTALISLKVDVPVVATSDGTLAAKKATQTIPIIFVAISDPLSLGVVASLRRPGGNITGLASLAGEVAAKWLELLKEVAPLASRVALLWNPETLPAAFLKDIQDAARALRVKLESFEVRQVDEFDRAFGAMSKQRVGGLIV